MSYAKRPRFGDTTSGPSQQTSAPFGTPFSPYLTFDKSHSENDPPANGRRPATHLNFPPAATQQKGRPAATHRNPLPALTYSSKKYRSKIDPTLMLPAERILPELHKVRAEIKLRDAIIRDQPVNFQKEYQQELTNHAAQVAAMRREIEALLKQGDYLKTQLAADEQTAGIKILDLSKAIELRKDELRAAEVRNADLQQECMIMAEEQKAVESGYMEHQMAVAQFQNGAKERLRLWMNDKEQLLAKVEALERDNAALMKSE